MTILDYEKELVLLTKKQEEFILHYNTKLTIIQHHSNAIKKIIELIRAEIQQPNPRNIYLINKYIKLIQNKLQPGFFQEFEEEELLEQDKKITQTLISALDANKEQIQNHLSELQEFEIAGQLLLLLDDINQERISLSDDNNENQSLEQINEILKGLIKRFKDILNEIKESFQRENILLKRLKGSTKPTELLNISESLKSINQEIENLADELKDHIIRPILGFLVTETLITQRVLKIGERKRITVHTIKRDIKTCTTPEEILTYLELISEYEELFYEPIKVNKLIKKEKKKARKEDKLQRVKSMKENARLKKLATRDKLTGVYNIRAFDSAMEEKIAECQRDSRKILTIVVIDIDHFKPFNDYYGHKIGDRVLQFVAQTILKTKRAETKVYRYGGEEFTVIFSIGTKIEEGLVGTERIRQTIEEDSLEEMEKINLETGINKINKITISGGVSTLQFTKDKIKINNNKTAIALFERADAALYKAKQQGRNKVLKGEPLIISE